MVPTNTEALMLLTRKKIFTQTMVLIHEQA
jgi:hypothetical protein